MMGAFIHLFKVKMKLLMIKTYIKDKAKDEASADKEKHTRQGRIGIFLVAALFLLVIFALSRYDMRTYLLEFLVTVSREAYK